MTSRYAVTVITSRVANRMEESKEIEFHVRIPKNAFITKFKMYVKAKLPSYSNAGEISEINHPDVLGIVNINIDFFNFRVIDGQEYDGIVKEKEKAQRQYSGAVSQGQSAGIIRYTRPVMAFLLRSLLRCL